VFNTILGIPAHPLLIHAAVVFIPLLIVAAIVYAALPIFRSRIDWAVVALGIIGPIAALFAKLSGQDLKQRLIDRQETSPQLLRLINQHNSFGNSTFWWTLALGILTLVLFAYQFTQGRQPTPVTADGTSTVQRARIVRIASTVVMIVLGGVVGYYVYRTGDTGAHMVWMGV